MILIAGQEKLICKFPQIENICMWMEVMNFLHPPYNINQREETVS